MCSRPDHANEILDVVDENDHVIGNAVRSDVHRLALRHRAAHVLVFDDSGHLLLQRRALHKDVNPGLWDTSAAGHVEQGESYESAARRELLEELGIRAREPLIAISRLQAEPETGWEFVEVFKYIHSGDLDTDKTEIIETRWVPIQVLNHRVFEEDPSLTLSFRKIWARVQGDLKQE